ncbi:MAG: hypothetical protein K0U38_09740 [Epsilonproteobacteria bacterium]|nr:hypothetical protein [Campylobacterota bacterium]
MKKIILALITLFTLLISTGCTPIVNKYRVNVDAITHNNANIQPSSYSIKALGSETDANGLRFQRHAQHLAKILNEKGYSPASYETLAEQQIYFDYGIDKIKEEHRTYREPEVTFGVSWGFPYGYYHHRYHPFWHDVGYTTYRTYEKTYRVFNRYIVILSKNQAGQELWRVDVSSAGESAGLEKIVPLLLDAAKPYIGTNTAEPIKLVIEENRDKKE